MKLFTSLCAIVVVVTAVKQEIYRLPPESLSKLKKNALPCAQEFNVDPINIRKLGDNTLPRDEATNKFVHCYALKSGFVDKDGHIILDAVVNIIKDHPRVEEFKETLKQCIGITKENPVATTVAAHMCYCENSIILFEYVE